MSLIKLIILLYILMMRSSVIAYTQISTIVGTGNTGGAIGDNGDAGSAQTDNPRGIWGDSLGENFLFSSNFSILFEFFDFLFPSQAISIFLNTTVFESVE